MRRLANFILALTILLAIYLLLFHKSLIQSYNLNMLLADGYGGRLLTHRVNSLGQLDEILDSGVRAFEVDLYFIDSPSGGRFAVGHNKEELSDLALDQFLAVVDTVTVQRIWLDIKNLSPHNVRPALDELLRLDSLYGLMPVAIVESNSQSSELAKINGAGFHLSYYLPTGRIQQLLHTASVDSLVHAALLLGKQVRTQRADAVSFDLNLYPFVKEHLEPVIPDSMVYHTWGSVKLWEWGAVSRLYVAEYFQDPRVETILYRYWY